MRLIYLTGLDYPSETATNRQAMSMAAAFYGRLGEGFVFVANSIRDLEGFGPIPMLEISCRWPRGKSVYSAWWLLKHARKLMDGDRDTVIYTKDSYLCILALLLRPFFGYRVAFESHLIYHSFRDRFIARSADAIFTVTSFLRSSLVKDYGAKETRVAIMPDAVDLDIFDVQMDRASARKGLDLPLDKTLFVYTGRFKTLGMDKGIMTALSALKAMNDQRLMLVAVGGSASDVKEYQIAANRLGIGIQAIFLGYVSQSKLALFQKAADALIMPFPFTEHFALYMSPLKMFEYMASKVPIIASDLPAVRDILDDSTAVIVKPGDPESLAEAMKKVAYGARLLDGLALAAYEKVKGFTWQKRAEKIIGSLFERSD
ncbi:MAG: glycosyltransferase family 4 protein [Patescibacteria group bacterium]|nr:glycosyltransferase family 4 protein [Patescibacteria group bacterium]